MSKLPTRDIRDASALDKDLTLEADVAVVGTGAGGATAAEILALAGLRVVMLEEGAYRTARDFTLHETDALANLYFDGGNRATKDGGIAILQGRSVGGSTTVNWTSTFRTPDQVLKHWHDAHGVAGIDAKELAPWFDRAAQRLHVAPWALPPNANNAVLARGAAKLGYAHEIIPRNVDHCQNLGYCGMGCPVNAKRGMLVTSVPGALDAGAVLLTRARAERVLFQEGTTARVTGVEAAALDARGVQPTGKRITVRAKAVVASGGGINTPALLLRSKVPDPNSRLGLRTFLHPTALSAATFPETIAGYTGAPQSVYSDQFLWRDGAGMPGSAGTAGVTGKAGYKLEVAPTYPMLFMSIAGRLGQARYAEFAKAYPHANAMIALQRDGFHPESPGGRVTLKSDGSPLVDYPIPDYHWESLFASLVTMAEIQFAAGATQVMPVHMDATPYRTLAEAKAGIAVLARKAVSAGVFSAHVMGGCAMGEDPKTSVVNSRARHHQVEGLAVIDGSVFPTSLGVNPQMSIYGLSARQATLLAKDLGGKVKAG